MNTEEAARNRGAAGDYVKMLRLEAGLTQRELAVGLNLPYYTFISQVETGKARVPPEAMKAWAKQLKKDTRVFAKDLLRWYDPHMYRALFDNSKR